MALRNTLFISTHNCVPKIKYTAKLIKGTEIDRKKYRTRIHVTTSIYTDYSIDLVLMVRSVNK